MDNRNTIRNTKRDPATKLTPHELLIANCIANGITNRVIAKQLGISVKTVDTHRLNILKRLGLKGNVALVRHALREGWVTL